MRHISEIIAEVFAGIKYPDALSIKTSVKKQMVVNEKGELQNAMIITTDILRPSGAKETLVETKLIQ